MINILYSFKVPDPVAFFPLNAAYGTKEINNRAVKGIASGVPLLLQGPMEDLTTLINFLEAPPATSSFPTGLEDLWTCVIR